MSHKHTQRVSESRYTERERERRSMEGEVSNVMKVSIWVSLLMTYARFASARNPPGRRRLLSLLPAICLVPVLPCFFTTIHLRGISAFFLTWLTVFKLLLLSNGTGPLSPSLPLLTFISIASLPVKLQPSKNPSPKTPNRRLITTAVRALLLSANISLYRFKNQIPHYLLLTLYCLHIYLALEIILAFAAFLTGALLRLELELQFDEPYRATSLQNFWGRRWNLMVPGILRSVVYRPVTARWGSAAGVLAAFLVSGVMHEVVFYYITLTAPTGEMVGFFVLHGLCTTAEVKAGKAGWRAPPAAGMIAVGFVMVTSFWLFFPVMVRNGVDERAVQEFEALVEFLGDCGRAVIRRLSYGGWTLVQ